MSGWIKWEKDLETDPRMKRMLKDFQRICNADALHHVTLLCGSLLRLWVYADSHIREDNTLDMGCMELDEHLGVPGFCSILPSSWLVEVDEHRVELPDFLEHNGTEAKKKALTGKRVANHRQRKRNATALPDQTRPDQTKPDQKEEIREAAAPPSDSDVPRGTSKADEEAVFEHWKRTWKHPSAILDAKRRARIRARLQNFTVDQLRDCISGFRNSPWHCGTDPKGQGKVYDAVDTLLRDTAQVEEGMRLLANPPRAPPEAENNYDRFMRNLNGSTENSRVIDHDPGFPAISRD